MAEMSDMPSDVAALLASAISINSSYTTSVHVLVVVVVVVVPIVVVTVWRRWKSVLYVTQSHPFSIF